MGDVDEGMAVRLANLWNRRKAQPTSSVNQARARVAHLAPAVVVTGGSRGIGEAIAERFAAAGHRVAIVARHGSTLEAAAARITAKTGSRVIAIVCDITAANAFDAIDRRLTDEGLYLDCLVNNAAIGLSGPFAEQDETQISDLIALNVTALTRLCRRALPHMLQRRRGGILNLASLGGYAPGPHQAAYYASKAYVLSLTEALACEASGLGVRIAVVAPGPVETRFHADMGAESALYRAILPSLAPHRVASSALRGFMFGQRVIIPHPFNRMMQMALKVLPHPISVPLVAWLLKNRTPRG